MKASVKYEKELRDLYQISQILLLIGTNTEIVPQLVSEGIVYLSNSMDDVLDRLCSRMDKETGTEKL